MHPTPSSYPAARLALARAFAVLLVWVVLHAVLLAGLEGWSFFRALFFVVITVTTVGYGDEGISEAGRGVAILTMLGGIGASSYAFAVMVQVVLARGADWRWRMMRLVERVEDHTVVAGYGKMGSVVCCELSTAGRTVLVVERDPGRLQAAREAGHLVVEGDATEERVLEAAGLERAAEVVACLDHDAANLAVVLTARHVAPGARIVARVERPDEDRRMRLAGADEVVCPIHAGAHDAARHIVQPGVTDLLGHAVGHILDLGASEIQVVAGSALDGQRLADLDAPGVSFVALLEHDGPRHVPAPLERVLEPGDLVVCVGLPDDVATVRGAAVRRRVA